MEREEKNFGGRQDNFAEWGIEKLRVNLPKGLWGKPRKGINSLPRSPFECSVGPKGLIVFKPKQN